MKTKHWFFFAVSVFAVAAAAGFLKNANRAAQIVGILKSVVGGIGLSDQTQTQPPPRPLASIPENDFALITEPSAGIAPILSMIDNASTSIDLVMYELEDTKIEAALAAAAGRGVTVRVLLNESYYGSPPAPGETTANEPAYEYLQAHGVAVRWTPAYFALTHQKTLVVDDSVAAIMTFNLTAQYYATSRDFGIIDRDANDVDAIEKIFANDWQGNQNGDLDESANANENTAGDDLVWSPGSKNEMLSLVNGAKASLEVYNEEMDDDDIVDALVAAAERGVAVEVVMTYSGEWKSAFQKLAAAGVEIRTYASSKKAPLYIHAKMILAGADDESGAGSNATVFIGSENFSESSLNENRELGIVMADKKIIAALGATFAADYKNGTVFAAQ